MMRSLYSGVSGLRNHQTRMDVIGNNIANVNTTGYKAGRTVFQDIYSQTLGSASASTPNLGGTNPTQIGLGVKLGAIDTLFTPGAAQNTDNPSDLMISGDGFFIVDINGTASGATDPIENGGMKYTRAGNFYIDNSGFLVSSEGYFVMGYTITDSDVDDDGYPIPFETDDLEDGAALQKIDLSAYTNITFDSKGVAWGYESDTGEKVAIAQVAIAMFANNSGLEKVGGSLYDKTANSGAVVHTYAGALGAGSVDSGRLEMANVDLAAEFTDMIITQRGFQANSRVITVSDTMLEELVNLKR